MVIISLPSYGPKLIMRTFGTAHEGCLSWYGHAKPVNKIVSLSKAVNYRQVEVELGPDVKKISGNWLRLPTKQRRTEVDDWRFRQSETACRPRRGAP